MIATERIPLEDFKRLGIEPLRFAREHERSMRSLVHHGRTALLSLALRLADNSDLHVAVKLEFDIDNQGNPFLAVLQPTAQIQSAWELDEKQLKMIRKGNIVIHGSLKKSETVYLYQHDPELNDIVRVNAEHLPVPITPRNLRAISMNESVKVGHRLFYICLWKPNFVI